MTAPSHGKKLFSSSYRGIKANKKTSLLSVLQIDVMVWPGMGAEVVFEVYKRQYSSSQTKRYVRVLWGGKVLRSSNPSLGLMDMLDLDVLLGYFDQLGVNKVATLCRPN